MKGSFKLCASICNLYVHAIYVYVRMHDVLTYDAYNIMYVRLINTCYQEYITIIYS